MATVTQGNGVGDGGELVDDDSAIMAKVAV